MPPSERDAGIRECERLFVDTIAAAARSIYIESQYFTNDTLARALAERLQARDGPEVIAVVPKECHGWVEQQTMGALRHQALCNLVDADRHGRLRIVYPTASREQDVPTFVHSKVMIVDDRLVRIGSANISRRSMGVDSECDLAAHAGDMPEQRAGVRRIRDRLIAEHLGMSPDVVAAEVERLGSLRALIDARDRAGADRALVRVDLSVPIDPPSEVVKAAADPDEPVGFAGVTDLIPPLDARADRGSIRSGLATVAIGVTILFAIRALVDTDGTVSRALQDAPRLTSIVWAGVAIVLVAHAALVPLELIAILAGVVLGARIGGLVAVTGAWTAAIVGYAVGRAIGTRRLSSWMSRRAYRSARQLGARGAVGVALLRWTSIASGGSIHLICGAGHVPFAAYLIGSIVGLTPVMIALSAVGGLIRTAFLSPSWSHGLLAAAGLLGAGALAFGVRSLLLVRQFSPTVRRHRERAEFG